MHLRSLAACFALSAALSLPAAAVPLAEMRAEDLMLLAADIKTQLQLNANQTTLWQQTEAKARAILRDRASRREALQSQARQMLSTPAKVELRELGALMDAETQATANEEKQLRALWLTVNDALDDRQRQLVATQVVEQMLRVLRPEAGARERGPEGGQTHQRGPNGGGRRGGGMPGGAGPNG
ncbi:hypothetical protein [Massilia sp. TS11]|uniref:hypothetical protein n=1 Tax=Massilia sp. TS11 TaxID=2908003 RepID=UPI001EDC4348|nr:hypothetical protein [Massilia sp. TS11]MCG2585782.1 hypothetical protein [Massilia sp. TS11]